MIAQAACLVPVAEGLGRPHGLLQTLGHPKSPSRPENLSRPQCPRCRTRLFMAEASHFTGDGCIEHAWSCDCCGHDFVTSVRL